MEVPKLAALVCAGVNVVASGTGNIAIGRSGANYTLAGLSGSASLGRNLSGHIFMAKA